MRIPGALNMGDVALIIKAMPESPDVDREELKKEIRARMPRVQDIQEEPIGFGLVALKVVIVVPDAEGQTDAAEAKINEIPGIERAEIIGSTLV
jgi:elongation factor 1-beta